MKVQTYLEWSEFDVNVVRRLIAICTYKSIVENMNDSSHL